MSTTSRNGVACTPFLLYWPYYWFEWVHAFSINQWQGQLNRNGVHAKKLRRHSIRPYFYSLFLFPFCVLGLLRRLLLLLWVFRSVHMTVHFVLRDFCIFYIKNCFFFEFLKWGDVLWKWPTNQANLKRMLYYLKICLNLWISKLYFLFL